MKAQTHSKRRTHERPVRHDAKFAQEETLRMMWPTSNSAQIPKLCGATSQQMKRHLERHQAIQVSSCPPASIHSKQSYRSAVFLPLCANRATEAQTDLHQRLFITACLLCQAGQPRWVAQVACNLWGPQAGEAQTHGVPTSQLSLPAQAPSESHIGFREREAPAEPQLKNRVSCRCGSAGASPSRDFMGGQWSWECPWSWLCP